MVKASGTLFSTMADSDRDEGGKYTPTVTDEEVLAAIGRASGPVVTTGELADVLPIGRRAIRERLISLQERGLVDRKKVGGRAVVWWRVGSTTTEPDDLAADPLFSLPTFSSGVDDVSENVDEHLATAIADENADR